jgi:hypothetical protein
MNEYTYSSSSTFSPPSPPRSFSPADGIHASPPTLTYNISAGELSSDGMPTGRASRGSGTHSPPSVPYAATVPRSHRFNPIAVPANRTSAKAAAHKRRPSRSNDDSDDDDEEFNPGPTTTGGGDSVPRDSYEFPFSLRPSLNISYLGAVKPFASSASSQNNDDATSFGKVMPVSRKPSLHRTRRPAKFISLIEVRLSSPHYRRL